MKLIWERMKLIVEPSAAMAAAAIFTQQFKQLDPEIKNVGVILCGGNTDVDKLLWWKYTINLLILFLGACL